MSQAEAQLALSDAGAPPVEQPAMGYLLHVPFRVAVTIPVHELKLRDLRSLKAGKVITTLISAAEDVPVHVGGALLGWAELDSVEGHMAIRLTRLS